MVIGTPVIAAFLLGLGLGVLFGFIIGDAHGWLDGLKEKRGVGR